MIRDNKELLEKQKQLPITSGCYMFLNCENKIIYVGKANNLKKRVESYFSKTLSNFKTIQLVNDVFDLKYISTSNEKEALILEFNLIKKYRPRYNILLNDDKKYLYIIITKEQDPEIKMVRNITKNYQYCFGPFPDGTKAIEILKIIKRLYPLRNCKKAKMDKPCLNYQINQCSGSCFKFVNFEFYKNNIKKIKLFFKGDTKNLEKDLNNKMLEYAKNYQFEEAQKIKNILGKINFLIAKQYIDISRKQNSDYVNAIVKDDYLIICTYFYRNGQLLFKDYKIFEHFHSDISSIVIIYLQQLYQKNAIPISIILADNLNCLILKNVLNCKIITAKKAEDKNIMNIIEKDALNFLYFNLQNKNSVVGKEFFLIKEMEKTFNLKKTPYILEMYDISNINDKYQTASVVVYKNGVPSHKDFKHYNLSGTNTSDYSRMKELMDYRFGNIEKWKNYIPDLIIVDGGAIQIKAIKETLPKELYDIDIIGIVKNKSHQTSHVILENMKKYYLNNNPTLFNYLSLLQDKVHTLAIKQHKFLRNKGFFKKETT